MNVLFFIGTVYYLVDHWRKAAGVIKSEVKITTITIVIFHKLFLFKLSRSPSLSSFSMEGTCFQVRSNFLIVLKLFFIMGTKGIMKLKKREDNNFQAFLGC